MRKLIYLILKSTMFAKKFNKKIIAVTIIVAALLGFSFTHDYFEVSKNLDIYNAVYRELNAAYVDGTKPGQLVKTSIDAMLGTLDPYTVYYPENEIEDFLYLTTGEYGGIGTEVYDIDNKIIVKEPTEGFAAFKAGLRAGDQIVGVNETNVEGKASDEILNLLRGQAGTPVKLKVLKVGATKPVEVNLTREEIKPKVVPYFGMIPNSKTGYIKFIGFTTTTCSQDVKNALIKLKEQGATSLILDIRGNLGGFLNEAVNIVNLFVERGQEIVFTKGKSSDWDKSYLSVNAPLDTQMPLAVLVDENSASASEIVSGALQDLDRAIIIGKRTFGKGLVQETRNLVYNAKIKITVAKYYIPSGRCVQALDYSNKDEDGRVLKVPDSLITAFKTKGGRIVYDGAGIMPDIKTGNLKVPTVVSALLNQYQIFNYATKYVTDHQNIGAASDFNLSDKDYDDFVAFVNSKKFEYKTRSELVLEEMKRSLGEENAVTDSKGELEALSNKLKSIKKDELYKNKAEIKRYLEDEIVSRYYFQAGRIEYGIKNDKEIEEATRLLKDESKIKALLSIIEKPTKPFNIKKKF